MHRTLRRPELLPLSQAVFERIRARQVSRLEALIRARVVQPAFTGRLISGELVAAYFQRCHDTVTQELQRQAQRAGKAEWLYLLRRSPHSWWTHVDDLVPSLFRRSLAEVITGIGGAPESPRLRMPGFLEGPAASLEVASLAAGVGYLSTIQWRLRESARGALFRLSPVSDLPEVEPDAQRDKATKRYLTRLVLGQGRFLRRAGLELGTLAEFDFKQPQIVTASPTIQPCWTVDEWGGNRSRQIFRTHSNFSLQSVSLNALDALITKHSSLLPSDWPSSSFSAIVATLFFATDLIQQHPTWTSILLLGYISFDLDLFIELADSFLPRLSVAGYSGSLSSRMPDSASRLLAELESVHPRLLPHRQGPVLRTDRNLVLLDVVAASQVLDAELSFPATQGEIANMRAGAFEDAVQEAIDASSWSPPASLRALRRVALKQKGSDVTDVDAIGVSGSTLLIVSCKSRVFTEALDRGDYGAMRNARTLVEEGSQQADRIATFLRANRIGDNYDFSGFVDILIPVCIPYPIWLPLGTATADLSNGLTSTMSLDELREALDQTRIQSTSLPRAFRLRRNRPVNNN